MEPTHRRQVEADQYQTVHGFFAIRPRADYREEVFEVPENELRNLPAGEYISIGGTSGLLREPDARLTVDAGGPRMETRESDADEWEPAELAAGSGRDYPFTRK